MGPFRKEAGVVRTKRTWLFVAGFGLLLLAFGPVIEAVLAALMHGHYLALLGVVAYYAAAFGLLYRWNTRWREQRGLVVADERGLWLNGEIVVARAAVRNGHFLDPAGVSRARLARWLRPVDVVVDGEAEANALLEAMRLDPSRSVGTYPMNRGTYRSSFLRAALFGVFGLGGIVAAIATLHPVVMLAWTAVAIVSSVLFVLNETVRVDVGADGIRVRSLARSEFVRFVDITSAETDGRNVTIRRSDGKTIEVHLPAGRRSKVHALVDRVEDARLLAARINEGVARHRRGPTEGALLARGDRDARTWMREVLLASDENASFRAPALPPDELWRVVEDPAADATARAGAALALRASLDGEGRARLRVVADGCAAPKLRVALEATAADTSDAELEAAYEALDRESPKARRASRAL